ncbi:hypothetical protein [Natrarchaeobius chitinivorans]|uniref:hypothetical protein n=1 Tax=Natrarchaeobius chitinivorans TaxID=1679083 RepID=UPI0014049483|nr:hypothetical protein [Natrarchaeobius chitinivorans]
MSPVSRGHQLSPALVTSWDPTRNLDVLGQHESALCVLEAVLSSHAFSNGQPVLREVQHGIDHSRDQSQLPGT